MEKSTPSRTWPSEPDEESKTEGGMEQRPKRNKREGIPAKKKCVTILFHWTILKQTKLDNNDNNQINPLLPHNFIFCTAEGIPDEYILFNGIFLGFLGLHQTTNNQTRGAIKMNNNLTENWCSHDDSEYQQHETTTEWRHRYSQTAVTQQDTEQKHTHTQSISFD